MAFKTALIQKYVPQKFIERPKKEFSVSIDSWLGGPLREWAEELLDERRLRVEGFLGLFPYVECGKSIFQEDATDITTCGVF